MEGDMLDDIRSWEQSLVLLLNQQEESNKVVVALLDCLNAKSSSFVPADVPERQDAGAGQSSPVAMSCDEEQQDVDEKEEEEVDSPTRSRTASTHRRSVIERMKRSDSELGLLHSGDKCDIWMYIHMRCKWLAMRRWFDYTIGCVIFINAICIGLETHWSINGEEDSAWPGQLDLVFVSIYTIELIIRIIAFGWKNITDPWFVFDAVLVVIGVISNAAIPMVFALIGDGADAGVFKKVLVVRSFRLLRLIRALRMTKTFRTAWRLVHGLVTSGHTMMSTLGILVVTLFIFACLGVEIITKDSDLREDKIAGPIIETNFSSLFATILTILQFVSMDSCAAIYFPLVEKRWYLVFYFLAIILFVSITLMNLVTAVLVEGALENTLQDKEMERHVQREAVKEAIPKLEKIFEDMDANEDGMLTLEEIENLPVDIIPRELFDNSTVSCMKEVFEILDVEWHGGGTVSKEQFVEGLLNMLLLDVPVHTVQTLQMLRLMDSNLKMFVSEIKEIRQRLASVGK
eukprot:TRINITY_DN29745_c0_g1_i1.p1 TRINITY_DN29745_c0_g1~~TRINITY_DN29745_c0_g1_i1.p1  ORF type:complete len:532 (+),score=92.80 TRINITY_DN29745_c0_g1_i1:50-1597(+)